MLMNMEAKKRIAAVIEKRGLTLAPIAKKIGTSYSTLWNFVYGETKNFGKIQRLADVLELSLVWIQNGDAPDTRKRFADIDSAKLQAGENLNKNQFQDTISLSVGIELAIKAAIGDGKKPSEDVFEFVRESLSRVAAGHKKPLTENEFIDYAKGFLAMKKAPQRG